ncbi:MAG: PocR ligand-binding domain-containing protein [Clostridium sp.]|nr:PocR ligand-binding domain-containing protein [Clostridium sp.]MCM1207356.1 PocR ligand-binding domain-containing protein [Ruminococcus sp.]
MGDIRLVELIETELLQKIQDSFSSLTGMAALTTDKDGTPITEGSNFTDFCMKYTRQSAKGAERCEKCDKMGAEICIENGRPHAYSCHGGLIDYAAPIMVHGKMIGSFIGGQVLSKKPDLDKFRKIARELEIDEEEYIEAVKKVEVIDKERIDNAAAALGSIAEVLSSLAYGRYLANKARRDTEFAMQARNEFFAKMSHEIRTPINTIIGMNEMIMRESTESNIRNYAMDINVAAKSMLSIVNDILDLSKLDSGNMTLLPARYDFSSLINDVVNMTQSSAEAKKLKLEIQVARDLPNILFGDDVRIRQILLNLLSNAVKYTKRGGITLSVTSGGYTEHGEVRLVFKVSDTGIGIKEEDIPELFKAFKRIDENKHRYVEGTGLGMNITNQLLFLMGSKLEVESVYGEGSTFSFVLEQKVMGQEIIGDIESRLKHMTQEYEYSTLFTAPDVKVLVVDDNEANRKVFKNLLKETKIMVEQADSGKQCLKKTADTKYDIIFLDHMMPELDGVETFHLLRNAKDNVNVNTPVVVLTANAVVGARDNYLAEGFDNYLSKPIIPENLEKLIADMLPREKLNFEMMPAKKTVKKKTTELPELAEFDWTYALTVLKTPELILQTAGDFYKTIEYELENLNEMYQNIEDSDIMEQYKIKVHSLKSTSKMIGALSLSGVARVAEVYAIDKDVQRIKNITPILMDELKKIKGILYEWVGDKNVKPPMEDYDEMRSILGELEKALKVRNLDKTDELVAELGEYSYEEELQEKIDTIAKQVLNLQMKKADATLAEIMEMVGGK